MNYYRRYVGDYARDTTALTLGEHGAYALLLDAYYADEHPLPSDLGMLYRICRATDKPEQAAVRAVAEKFFPVNGDGLRHNARADRELGKAKSAIDQMTEAGVRGAAKRWGPDRVGDRGGDRVPHGKTAKRDGVAHAGGDRGGDAGADRGGDTTTNHQPPTTSLQPPTTSHQPAKTSAAAKRRVAESDDPAARARPTWQSYVAAIQTRYPGRKILRDKQANGQMAKFVDRVGVEDGPQVAAFYVDLNKRRYVDCQHSVATLLACVEELYSQWTSGRQVTEAGARQTDRSAARGQVFLDLIAEAKETHDAP